MSQFLKPRVKETFTATGTGSLQLLGAMPGYSSFLNAFGASTSFYYSITQEGSSAYEYGLGFVNSSSQLTRALTIGSSTGGAIVSWGAGTKTVVCAIIPEACLNNGYETFTASDTTPSVKTGNTWRATNGSATTITQFDDGIDGQQITVLFTNGNTTIQANANLKLSGGVNFVGTAEDIMTLVKINAVWYEKSRSVNA